MVTGMDDRIEAIRRERPDRIPIGAGVLPTAWMKHREAMDEVVRRHPLVFGRQGQREVNVVNPQVGLTAWRISPAYARTRTVSISTCTARCFRSGTLTVSMPT